MLCVVLADNYRRFIFQNPAGGGDTDVYLSRNSSSCIISVLYILFKIKLDLN